jgi:hypothetical protein
MNRHLLRTLSVALLASTMLAACRTASAKRKPASASGERGSPASEAVLPEPSGEMADASPAASMPFKGEVVRVNRSDRYVIVQCAALPSEGQTYRVYRGFSSVALIRFTGAARRPFAAADILEGLPQAGDRVQE